MCKIRAGYDEFIDVASIARIIEENGASALTVHGRTRKMFYSGLSDWGKIAEAKSSVKIPVIGNGDILSAKSALDMFNQTKCDAVMVGRGAQGNPFIFAQINEFMKNGKVTTNPSDYQKLKYMKEHLDLLIKLKGEYVGIREARKHVAWYTKGMHGGTKVRSEIFKTQSYDSLINILEKYMEFICERDGNI